MAVTYTKTQVTRVNPFDGTSETLFNISNVQINGTSVKESYSFSLTAADATILSVVQSDLTAKGYTI